MPILRLALAVLLLLPLAACMDGSDDGEEEGSATMRPGENCLACHGFTAAGTVYDGGDAATAAGVSGATVEITDSSPSAQPVVTLTTNSVGNFYTSAALTPPLQVRITHQGNVAPMTRSITTGACASCHYPGTTPGTPARVHVGACTTCHP